MLKKCSLLLITLLFAMNANAIVELRAGYGIQTPAEENYNGSTLKTVSGLNFDAIVELPMIPVGLGLRYEDMSFDVTQGLADLDSSLTRTSLLINYRIIDLFAYFGLIGTIGFVNEAEIDLSAVSAGIAKYDSSLTTTIGVEGGVSLGLLMIGAELGYAMGTYSDANSNGNPDLDMDGVYLKALVGVSL